MIGTQQRPGPRLSGLTLLIAITLLVGHLLAGCSSRGTRLLPEQLPAVYRIDTGFGNVYLVKGEKLILIDTGVPDKREMIMENIKKLGFDPAQIALVVVTHGHADHAGNAKFFQTRYKLKIAGGAGDRDKFENGRTDLSKAESIGVMARLLRSMSDSPYEAFVPDVMIGTEEISLAEYGVAGSIIPLPGHTKGSAVVLVGDLLFAGDLLRGGVVFSGSPTEHFFHEDRALARRQLGFILGRGVRVLLPGHFGPLDAADARRMTSP